MRKPFCGHLDQLQDANAPLGALQCVAECPVKVSWVMQLRSAEDVNVNHILVNFMMRTMKMSWS